MTPARVATRGGARRAAVTAALGEQLAPVRTALLDDAERRAEAILAAARETADAVVAAARAEADQAVARATERAAATARARREQARAAARREVHRTVLEAESQARQAVLDAAVAATAQMPADPRYPRLLDRLEQLAHEQLGTDALVTHDPATGPGLVAKAGGRRVDYRLATLARRALESRGDPLLDARQEVTS